MTAPYTAVYQENEDTGHYELLFVVSHEFLAQEGRELWLVEFAQELADGDLWAVRLIEGEELSDFDQILES